jgi:hypothetical protein
MLKIAVFKQGWPKLGLKSQKKTKAVTKAVAAHVNHFRKKFLCKSTYSVILTILF